MINSKLEVIMEYMKSEKIFQDEMFEYKFLNIIKHDYLTENLSEEFLNIKPIWVGLKVTPKCNFHCKHCWAQLRGKERKLEEIYEAINKLVKMDVKHITLSGGEPFLRDDIFEIIEYIKKKNVHLAIFSNGYFIDEKIVSRLEHLLDSYDFIQVSLDGFSKEKFESQRGENTFEKVMMALEILGQSSLIVRVNMVASKYNVDEILSTYEISDRMNINTFSVSHIYDLNKGKDMYDELSMIQFLDEIINCINVSKKLKTKLKPFIPTQYYEYISEEIKYNNKLEIIDYNFFLYRFIDSQGNIYPDVAFDCEEFCMGNIYTDDAEIILEKSFMIGNKLKKRSLGNTKCAKCSCVSMCHGGDIERTYKYYRDINQADPFCKRR